MSAERPPEGTHRYFAYGSNLSLAQMTARCPSAVTECRARLDGWRLDFVQPHERWNGGVASIAPAENRQVHGAIYQLSDADLRVLDGFEPVANEDGYRRIRVTVTDEAGAAIACWTYVGAVHPGAPFAPSRRYLHTILAGAREHSLPPAYIAALAAEFPAHDA